jgi:hypothetical protein
MRSATTTSPTAEAIESIVSTGVSSSPTLLSQGAQPAHPAIVAPGSPELGSTVKYMNREAQVAQDGQICKIRPTGLVDILVYEKNGPRVFDRVPYSDHPAYSTWSYANAYPKPPATLDELLAAREAEGLPTLSVGLPVLYVFNGLTPPESDHTQKLEVRRARVLRPTAIDRADLELFVNDEPPLDPEDDDPIQIVARGVEYDPSPGICPNRFIWVTDAWTPPPRARICDIRPRWRCSRCPCHLASRGASSTGERGLEPFGSTSGLRPEAPEAER